MIKNFENYNHILVNAFIRNQKQQEILARKIQLIQQVYKQYDFRANVELFVGFNPAILATKPGKAYVIGISDQDFALLENLGCTAKKISSIKDLPVQVDSTISGDEFFTFIDGEAEQRNTLEQLRACTRNMCVTTLRDYKNQDFKDKEFSFPSIIRNDSDFNIHLEFHDHDIQTKNSWNTHVYVFNNQSHRAFGPFPRRAVYFKQLAKFAQDAGFANFHVHKNLMYKSIIRKNYEHVISFN